MGRPAMTDLDFVTVVFPKTNTDHRRTTDNGTLPPTAPHRKIISVSTRADEFCLGPKHVETHMGRPAMTDLDFATVVFANTITDQRRAIDNDTPPPTAPPQKKYFGVQQGPSIFP